jgi:hypothetical protein
MEWYRRAAEQGFALAVGSFAAICDDGRGVPKDRVEAYAWFSRLPSILNELTGLRERLASEMTPEEIAEAGRLASRVETGNTTR